MGSMSMSRCLHRPECSGLDARWYSSCSLIPVLYRSSFTAPNFCSLGTTGGCVVRAWRAPGVLDLILRTLVQHFFEDISIIRPTPCASVLRGREGRLLATLALEQDAL